MFDYVTSIPKTLRRSQPRKLLMLGLGTLVLSGCAVVPNPINIDEVKQRVHDDQLKMYATQESVNRPITFDDALARSLKYNLDYRLKLMESALSAGLLNVTKYDMLPNLVVSSGYTSRDNLTATRSFTINRDGTTSDTNSYSGGIERQRWMAGVDLSWSILDFGMGYYRAKQKADEVLIAEERRRQVVQNILKDLRSAYWRAAGAQRLAKEAEALTVRVRSALNRSRIAEAEGLMPPKDALTYQRMLLDAVALLSTRRQELDLAKRELAALMNMPAGTDFTIAEQEEPPLPAVPTNLGDLEEMALTNRPELRQEDYRARITADEARKQLLSILPNLSLDLGGHYDSNKYLYNNNWVEASSRVTFNLLKVFSYPEMKKAQEAQVNVDDTRRMALSMAVLTQVRVAVERYQMALRDLDIAKESSQVDQRLASYARAAQSTRADTELESIRAETRALNSEFQRYSAYAAAQAAYGKLYASLGLEVVPPGAEQATVQELGGKVDAYVRGIESRTFVHYVASTPQRAKLHLRVESAVETLAGGTAPAPLDGNAQAALNKAVSKALRRNNLNLSEKDEGAYRLSMQLVMQPVRNGVRKADWVLSMVDMASKPVGRSRYSSILASQPSTQSLQAFAEAAAISNLRQIDAWMSPRHD